MILTGSLLAGSSESQRLLARLASSRAITAFSPSSNRAAKPRTQPCFQNRTAKSSIPTTIPSTPSPSPHRRPSQASCHQHHRRCISVQRIPWPLPP
ncbi:hypothetical protein C1H46_044235 [Malus baccata]|uniref:Uncharacterized protein n=1 Tax=Malus baccata TaxID=106549 RepID=A0A540K7M9_MALBA|nr:hypothetical protein C1H46_044235 [Malus baccata]